MEIVFRPLRSRDISQAGPGEILIHPADAANRKRLDLSVQVLQQGVHVFISGEGPIQRLVVDADPTLDDLLAATFAERQLQGEKLPEGCLAFARYAALVREGLNPSTAEPQESFEGVFQAMRRVAADRLGDAAVAAQFQADWQRLARYILTAAAADADPTVAIASGTEFLRERTYLRHDQDLYRQDVARGERWRIELPGGPPRGAALLLRKPKSLLFKYWCRHNLEAPEGLAFLFLAVDRGQGSWRFSTDPVHRLSLKELADALQTAEAKQDTAGAKADPWFDGKQFNHTLVSAPPAGTKLADKAVVSIAKTWLKGKTLAPRPLGVRTKWAWASGLAALLLIVVGGIIWFPSQNGDKRKPNGGGPPTKGGVLHVLTIGISKYKDPQFNPNKEDACADKDAKDISQALATHAKALFSEIKPKPLINEDATKKNINIALSNIAADSQQDDFVVVTLSGHGRNFNGDQDFYFLPYDYDDDDPTNTGLFWYNFYLTLQQVRCTTALVVMDACYSGAVAKDLNLNASLQNGLNNQAKKRQSAKLVVIASCRPNEQSQVIADAHHGILSLALLEALERKYNKDTRLTGTTLPKVTDITLLDGDKSVELNVVTLWGVYDYAKKRVKELSRSQQGVAWAYDNDLDLTRIYISEPQNKE